MLRSTRIDIRHEVLPLAHEGMWQSAIAGRMALTRATINRFYWRHGAIETLVPGKSTRAPRKTAHRLDCTLIRIVPEDHFISAWALTVQMRIFLWNEGWLENHQQTCI